LVELRVRMLEACVFLTETNHRGMLVVAILSFVMLLFTGSELGKCHYLGGFRYYFKFKSLIPLYLLL
jgi:hypothetical protein